MDHWKIDPVLPVFLIEHAGGYYLWAEGLCIPLLDNKNSFRDVKELARQALIMPAAEPLIRAARYALTEWRNLFERDFFPTCLSIIPNYDCNLNCGYCYNVSSGKKEGLIGLDAVSRAAFRVASACREEGAPFVLVVTGGGEPTLHWDLLCNIVHEVESITQKQGVRAFTRLVTNATLLDGEKCRWLSQHFNLVSISYDGKPASQKPVRIDCTSYENAVLQACADIRANGGMIDVRVTVTPDNFMIQDQIIANIIHNTGCTRVNIEPVFGAVELENAPRDVAERFAAGYIAAGKRFPKSIAQIQYSGMRANEVHGPYCDVFRSTLRLFPGGMTSLCFLGKAGTPYQQGIDVPRFDRNVQSSLFQQFIANTEDCSVCLAQLHCTRGCPDVCLIGEDVQWRERFRCMVNRHIYEAHVLERISGLAC